MGGTFRKKLVWQNAMSTDGYPSKSSQTRIYMQKQSSNLIALWAFCGKWSFWSKKKKKNDQIWHKLVVQSTKLVGQPWKLVGKSPYQLYREVRPWVGPQCFGADKAGTIIIVTWQCFFLHFFFVRHSMIFHSFILPGDRGRRFFGIGRMRVPTYLS